MVVVVLSQASKDILTPAKSGIKGNYSFIFTTAHRSQREGQSWRPAPESLKPICPCTAGGRANPA